MNEPAAGIEFIWPNERKVFPKKKVKGVRIENIKPQYDRYYLPGNKSIYLLAEVAS